jgi:CRP/FNR family transcriptional regulator, cyclic AMP receptor protein
MSRASIVAVTALKKEFLESSEWYAALTGDLQQLVYTTATQSHCLPGDCIVSMGEPSLHWLGVIDGFLKMSIMDSEGNEAVLYCLCKDEWGGEGSLLKKEMRRYSVIAMTPSTVCTIPFHTFNKLCAESLSFNQFLVKNTNNRMSVFIGMLQAARLSSPEYRVACCLLMLARGHDAHLIPLDISQYDIALISGLSRQRTNAALQVLKCKKLIHAQHYGHLIVDSSAVEQYLALFDHA